MAPEFLTDFPVEETTSEIAYFRPTCQAYRHDWLRSDKVAFYDPKLTKALGVRADADGRPAQDIRICWKCGTTLDGPISGG